jgi:hypothetical protein
MYKKIIINESEKNKIKNLYQLNEQGSLFGISLDGFFDELKKGFSSTGDSKSTTDKKEDSTTNTTTNKKVISNTSGSVESNWMDVTKKVIDNFEGGYWNHWQCKEHPYSSMFDKSGETMFGLDRKAGNIENLASEGKEFFKIIDDEKKKLGMSNFCKKWKWNYKGGELEEKLKDLASKIMFKSYERNMSNFVKDPETKKRIEGNKGLLLHMSYACWNGPGFFKKFAQKLESAVKEGKSDADLLKIAKDSRTQSLSGAWAKGTTKVNSLIDTESGLA